jgi:hypothetical protein
MSEAQPLLKLHHGACKLNICQNGLCMVIQFYVDTCEWLTFRNDMRYKILSNKGLKLLTYS